jgi:hypothetical protein
MLMVRTDDVPSKRAFRIRAAGKPSSEGPRCDARVRRDPPAVGVAQAQPRSEQLHDVGGQRRTHVLRPDGL